MRPTRALFEASNTIWPATCNAARETQIRSDEPDINFRAKTLTACVSELVVSSIVAGATEVPRN
jgi:hypothetical protein